MKTLNSGLVLVLCFTLCGCATSKQAAAVTSSAPGKLETSAGDSADAPVKLLRITANVDGSGRIVFTSQGVRYEHLNWSPPVDVTFDGEPWSQLDQTPAGWCDLSGKLDLSRAWIVKRAGRDVIALEQTPKGFDLYLCDSPNGSADYEVTIAIPRKD
jgi:hypothetical protein